MNTQELKKRLDNQLEKLNDLKAARVSLAAKRCDAEKAIDDVERARRAQLLAGKTPDNHALWEAQVAVKDCDWLNDTNEQTIKQLAQEYIDLKIEYLQSAHSALDARIGELKNQAAAILAQVEPLLGTQYPSINGGEVGRLSGEASQMQNELYEIRTRRAQFVGELSK